MQKATSIIFIAMGLCLLIWGRKIADSFGSQVQQVFTGAPTDRAIYLYVSGLVVALLGVAQIFWKRNPS
jgi:amino acid permease